MKEIIILRGLPFSGKTTWAEKFKSSREGSDSLNVEEIMEPLISTYRKSDRWSVVKNIFIRKLNENDIIIIDDVNILTSSINRILEMINSYKLVYRESFVVRIQNFSTPYSLCVKRAEKCGADEIILKRMKHYYNHCLRRKIIYKNEENS